MTHPSFISLPYLLERDPPPFEGNDIKYPEGLVRYFLTRYTKKGAKVFDPFAGLGTTLFVAEEMDRVPYGVEADPLKHEWVAGQMDNWTHFRCGDSISASRYGFPKMDFCMTSPPFMARTHRWNPLYNGDPCKAGYDLYLKRMRAIFGGLVVVMKKGAYLVVQVDNIPGRVFTPLVRDLGMAISESFRQDGEVIAVWENGRPGYPHTHCLIFRNV